MLLGLSAPRVGALAAAALVALCGLLVFGAPGLVLIVIWLPVALSAFIRVGTQPVVEWFPTWIQFRARRRSGQTEYRTRLAFQARPSGVMALAGDAASLRFHVDADTGAAMIEDPHRHTLTAVLAVSHPAFVLLDPSDQDSRVSRWGRVQAHLANSGTVATLQILEALVPDRGDSLQDYYAGYGTHDGGWADQQYAVLLEQTRLGSSTHRTTISLSLDMKAAAPAIKAAGGGTGGAVAVLRGDLAALAEQIRQAGLTVRGWLGEAEMGAIIRGAYDPATTVDSRIDPGANLTRAGPVAISEAWGHFRHDTGWSFGPVDRRVAPRGRPRRFPALAGVRPGGAAHPVADLPSPACRQGPTSDPPGPHPGARRPPPETEGRAAGRPVRRPRVRRPAGPRGRHQSWSHRYRVRRADHGHSRHVD